MEEEKKDVFSGESTGIFKEKEPRIKKGVTAGRIVNGLLVLNYFLVFLTALIVTGITGEINNNTLKKYPDTSPNNRTCILFSSCVGGTSNTTCSIQYNSSGGCDFIAAGFGIVAILALAYMIVCIVRIVFSTNIAWSVIADIVVNICTLVGVMVMGITISIGLAITCSNVNKHYRSSGAGNCSGRAIPNSNGYRFYAKTNASQGAAWFCFLFLVIAVVSFIVRSCILFRRRAKIPAMPSGGKEILTAEDKPI